MLVYSHKEAMKGETMEHLGNISRRQLLALGAVATGSLLIPSIAYAATDEKQDSDKNSPILRTTLLTKDGELIATTENGPIAKYSENEFSFNESIHKTINSDGSITLTYSVEKQGTHRDV